METENTPLAQLVAKLPQIYQPLFNHPELSAQVGRRCEDRFVPIAQTYKLLEQALKRPLRVLDLGCAQGFFSLNLARLGASVLGIDMQEPNIAVCQALAAEHPQLDARFAVNRIENFLGQVGQDDYDLVLGLSVFHHVVNVFGREQPVQNMLAALGRKTAAGIFEMETPACWAGPNPPNPQRLLSGYAFVHELGQYGTIFSSLPRPLYVASNGYRFFNGPADSSGVSPLSLEVVKEGF